MVLEIRLSNFFSIKDEVRLDLRAGKINNQYARELRSNVFPAGNEEVLKTIAIYGANASGKTSILKSINLCRSWVIWSHTYNQNSVFDFTPFKFDGYTDKPSSFWIQFILEGVTYEYGFRLTQQQILSEALWHYPNGKRAKVFTRNEQNGDSKADIYSFGTGVIKRPMDVAENTSEKTLYVCRGSQMDREVLKKVYRFFADHFISSEGNEFLVRLFQRGRDGKDKELMKALAIADSDIDAISVHFEDAPAKSAEPDDTQSRMVFTSYHKKDPTVPFDFWREESEGTQTMFRHLINVLDAVKHNRLILLDEIDRSLHPKIVEYLISLFHASESAQLIFTTHNTHHLDLTRFRKDQIYFANKKEDASTDLYSLYDYKDFRENMDLEKAYLQGRFDAVPIVNDDPALLQELVK